MHNTPISRHTHEQQTHLERGGAQHPDKCLKKSVNSRPGSPTQASPLIHRVPEVPVELPLHQPHRLPARPLPPLESGTSGIEGLLLEGLAEGEGGGGGGFDGRLARAHL